MSRIQVKNLPRLRLTDLLRRRKTTLRSYLDEFGITTYEVLVERCERMGVAEPEREEFDAAAPVKVNSPAEGVVVLEAPKVVKESTGKYINPDDPVLPTTEVVVITEAGQIDSLLAQEPTDAQSKKPKKKKESLPGNFNE